jgi:hypothetical protein
MVVIKLRAVDEIGNPTTAEPFLVLFAASKRIRNKRKWKYSASKKE